MKCDPMVLSLQLYTAVKRIILYKNDYLLTEFYKYPDSKQS